LVVLAGEEVGDRKECRTANRMVARKQNNFPLLQICPLVSACGCEGLNQRESRVAVCRNTGSYFWSCWLGRKYGLGGGGSISSMVSGLFEQVLLTAVQAQITLTTERTQRLGAVGSSVTNEGKHHIKHILKFTEDNCTENTL